jgi:hypothetical protein
MEYARVFSTNRGYLIIIMPAAMPTRSTPITPMVTVLSIKPDLGSSGGGVGFGGALQQDVTDGLSIQACW